MRIGLLFTLGIAALMLIAAQAQRDGATIRNSGSTNTAPYAITLWSDGTASVSVQDGAPRTVIIPREVSERFFTDVKAARDENAPPQHCMKSASFGTRTTVAWHGWTSPDLQCPPLGANIGALASDVRAIQGVAGLVGPLHRIGLPPSLRKIPETTPEVTPT